MNVNERGYSVKFPLSIKICVLIVVAVVVMEPLYVAFDIIYFIKLSMIYEHYKYAFDSPINRSKPFPSILFILIVFDDFALFHYCVTTNHAPKFIFQLN